MDEIRTKKSATGTHTTINRTETKPLGGNGTMWFLMGGLVVVVAIVGYLVMGEGGVPIADESKPAGGNVSINVETNDAPAGPAPTEAAPTEAAPVESTPTPVPTETTPQAD